MAGNATDGTCVPFRDIDTKGADHVGFMNYWSDVGWRYAGSSEKIQLKVKFLSSISINKTGKSSRNNTIFQHLQERRILF